jgi:hypothetical protein
LSRGLGRRRVAHWMVAGALTTFGLAATAAVGKEHVLAPPGAERQSTGAGNGRDRAPGGHGEGRGHRSTSSGDGGSGSGAPAPASGSGDPGSAGSGGSSGGGGGSQPASPAPPAAPAAAPIRQSAPAAASPRAQSRVSGAVGRVIKKMVRLLPLAELGRSVGSPGSRSPRAARGQVVASANGRSARRAAGSAPRAPGRHSVGHSAHRSRGPLPFTGFALLSVVLVGVAFLLVGGPLRRSTAADPRREETPPEQAVASRPAPSRGAVAPRRRALSVAALLGLVGLALLVGARVHASARTAA